MIFKMKAYSTPNLFFVHSHGAVIATSQKEFGIQDDNSSMWDPEGNPMGDAPGRRRISFGGGVETEDNLY